MGGFIGDAKMRRALLLATLSLTYTIFRSDFASRGHLAPPPTYTFGAAGAQNHFQNASPDALQSSGPGGSNAYLDKS